MTVSKKSSRGACNKAIVDKASWNLFFVLMVQFVVSISVIFHIKLISAGSLSSASNVYSRSDSSLDKILATLLFAAASAAASGSCEK